MEAANGVANRGSFFIGYLPAWPLIVYRPLVYRLRAEHASVEDTGAGPVYFCESAMNATTLRRTARPSSSAP